MKLNFDGRIYGKELITSIYSPIYILIKKNTASRS